MRRLNGENLLPFILAEDFFDSEKRRYEVAIGSECPASAQNNQKKKIEKDQKSMENLCPKLQKYDIIIR